jgi:uncharacterized protein (DUF305 family)
MIQAPKVRQTVRVPAVAVTVLLAILIAGCGADGEASDPVVGQGASRRNSADVEFATTMIPHHAQAVAMINLTLGGQARPELARTAEEILMEQTGETSKMSTWLQDWGKPVPRTMIDHVGHTMGDTSMPGALSKAEFHHLEKANGREFERMWLDAMIAHHEGAIEIAQTEQANGANPAAKRLAAQMIQTQQAQLEELRRLLPR